MKPKGFIKLFVFLLFLGVASASIDPDCNHFDCFHAQSNHHSSNSRNNGQPHHRIHNPNQNSWSNRIWPGYRHYASRTLQNALPESLQQATIDAVNVLFNQIMLEFYSDLQDTVGGLSIGLLRLQTNRSSFEHYHSTLDVASDQQPPFLEAIQNLFSMFNRFPPDNDLVIFESFDSDNGNISNHEAIQYITEQLDVITQHFSRLEGVYNFIKDLKNHLHMYSSFDTLNSADITKLQAATVIEFLDETKLIDISDEIRSAFKDGFITIEDKDYIVQIIKETKPWKKCSCGSDNELTMAGNVIRLSDLEWPSPCAKDKVKRIFIFASDTAFLDIRIQKGDGFGSLEYISIVAPKWDVLDLKGSVSFDLIGEGGKSGNRGSNCEGSDGRSGSNGDRGEPGNPGGNVFSIAAQVYNGAKLFITTKGGTGGNGGDGGNPCEGTKGRDADRGDLPSAFGFHCMNSADRAAVEQLDPGKCYVGNIKEGGKVVPDAGAFGIYNYQWGTITGFAGGKGGNGGDGADAGHGGENGIVNIVQLPFIPDGTDTSKDIKIDNSRPNDGNGNPGKGGAAGLEGLRGENYCSRWVYYLAFVMHWGEGHAVKNDPSRFTRKATGERGKDGGVSSNTVPAIKAPKPWKAINNYKASFMRYRLSKSENSGFLDFIEGSPRLLPYLTAPSFADELLSIEADYFKRGLKESRKFEPIYNNLLERIKTYANFRQANIGTQDFSDSEKVGLNFVYSSTLGKLAGMRGMRNVIKVVNTTAYFDYLENEMEVLKKDKNQVVIQEEKKQYQAKLDDKVKEAMDFIKEAALPAVDEAQNTIRQEEQKMKDEMQKYLNMAEKDVEEKKKALRDFQNKAGLRVLFGGLQFLGVAVSFLGPWGQAAGTALDKITSVGKPFLLGDDTALPSNSTFKLPDTFYKSSNSSRLNEKVDFIQQEIDKIEEIIKENKPPSMRSRSHRRYALGEGSSGLTGLSESVGELDKNLKELKEKMESGTFLEELQAEKKVDESREEVKSKIGKELKSDETKKELDPEQKKKLSATDVAMKLGPAGMAFYNDVIKAPNDKEKALKELVDEAKAKVALVEKRKQEMYKNFMPFLDKMMKQVQSETDLAGTSTSGLLVKKWQVQKMLLTMKDQIAQFTKGLEVSEEMTACVDLLDNAMTLLIDLYNNIENYEERKQLADYIANLNSSPDAIDVATRDPEMKDIMPKLKFSIHANLFLAKYQLALDTFKQWVFPFGEQYIDRSKDVIDLNDILQAEQNINLVTEKYMDKIKQLNANLKLYKSAILHSDQKLLVSNFTSAGVSSSPFYVWKNKTWKNIMEKLLAGEKVNLMAYVQDAEPTRYNKAAIKFKTVRVNFKATDSSLQSGLDEDLNHFHMSMTHSGVSNYQIRDKDYITYDNPLQLRYSFEEGVTVNNAAEKLDEFGDFLMSPYTMWTFQLKKAGTSKDIDFSALARFAGKVDLELSGYGTYIEEAKPYPIYNFISQSFYREADEFYR